VLLFFGIEVASSSKGYLLSQSKYVVDLFEHSRHTDNKIVYTPIEKNVWHSPSYDIPLNDSILYQTIVGSLVYVTVTRQDIAHVIHVVNQFVSATTIIH